MALVTVQELLDAGVHFGHRTSRWNPKMAPYIHTKRNTIHIIDLRATVRGLLRATHFLRAVTAEGEARSSEKRERQARLKADRQLFDSLLTTAESKRRSGQAMGKGAYLACGTAG